MKLYACLRQTVEAVSEVFEDTGQPGHIDGWRPSTDIKGAELQSPEMGSDEIEFLADGPFETTKCIRLVLEPVVWAERAKVSAEWDVKVEAGASEDSGRWDLPWNKLHTTPAAGHDSMQEGLPERSSYHFVSLADIGTSIQLSWRRNPWKSRR
jgi:hypothetical protein